MSSPLVTVIIPNYNGIRYLPRLMASLEAQLDDRLRVVVIDDRSTDESVEYLRDAWPDVTVRCNELNLGFAGSCNAGMRLATTPFVSLLNNDTHVDESWLGEALEPFDEARVGAVASLVLLAEPPHLIDTAGDIYSVAGGAVKRNHLEPRDTAVNLGRRVFSPCGASAFYRREAVAEVGFLDERFVSYYEDVDLGFRLAWAGHQCVFAPNSICYHHLSSSYSPTGWSYHYNSARNAELVWWSHMSARLRRKHFASHLLFLALQGVAEARRGRAASFIAGKWSVLRYLSHIRAKREADARVARVGDGEIEAILVQEWWDLHVGPKIKKLGNWIRGR